MKVQWELCETQGGQLCPFPNTCFEPAHFSNPNNALAMCFPPGLSPNSIHEHVYSIRPNELLIYGLLMVALGLIIGIFVGLIAYHCQRRRHHSASFVRGGIGRETLNRFRHFIRRGDRLGDDGRPGAHELAQVSAHR